MIYRRLGSTDIQISLLSLGSGGYSCFGQRTGVPESEIHKLIHRAIDHGINHFDTAAPPSYMDSELILGRGLKGVSRDSYTFSTKFAIVDDDTREPISADLLLQKVESSLRNLRVDELDVLLLAGTMTADHYPNVIDDLRPTLEGLKREGKVRHIGSSEKSGEDGDHTWLSKAVGDDLIEVVMVAYNMMNQSAERTVFPTCREKDVGAMGIFTVRNAFSQPEALERTVRDLKAQGLLGDDVPDEDPLGWLVDDEEPSLVSTGYRFSLSNDAISTIMTGTIDIAHLEANVASIQKPPLSPEKIRRLKELFGHLSEVVGN